MGDPDVSDLATSTTVARMLGLAHTQSVWLYARKYPEFPAPVFHEGRVALWSKRQVLAWAAATGRTASPPPET